MAGRCSPGELCALRSVFVVVALTSGCNSILGIREGSPRPICVGTDNAMEPLIDDMEDGDGFICDANGRQGHWFTYSDETSTDLTPAGVIDPALIPGGRGSSHYAAHLAGSGFAAYAGMAFDLSQQGLARGTYDASTVDGIKFWMKSKTPILVTVATPETLPAGVGGQCTGFNCLYPFGFQITSATPDWVEYEVPFSALRQPGAGFPNGGSATWNPRSLFGIGFGFGPQTPVAAFDVWVDDVRFYKCGAGGCRPTCTDPDFPVRCTATADSAASCLPADWDCAVGCSSSNTVAAPADGFITTFDGQQSGVSGGVDITPIYAVVALGPIESAPQFTTNGALHITLNAPVTSTAQVLLVDFGFDKCVDASAFTGLQFSISGSLSGCTFGQATQDSAHLHDPGGFTGPQRHGIGAAGAHPNSGVLTRDQITQQSQTVMMPFAAQTGGVPATPTDKSKLTWIDWVFRVDPYTVGGPASCTADLTIDDVRFY